MATQADYRNAFRPLPVLAGRHPRVYLAICIVVAMICFIAAFTALCGGVSLIAVVPFCYFNGAPLAFFHTFILTNTVSGAILGAIVGALCIALDWRSFRHAMFHP